MMASGRHLLVAVVVLAVSQWGLLTALPFTPPPTPQGDQTPSRTSGVALDITVPPPLSSPSASSPPPSSPPQASPPKLSPPQSSPQQPSTPQPFPPPSSPPQASPPQSSPPQSSPPPSSSQRPLTRPHRHPCTPTRLEAWTNEDTNDTLTFYYRSIVEDPEACKGRPKFTKSMVVSSCDDYTLYNRMIDNRVWRPKMNDSVEMCFGGCLKLECGAFTSNKVYLPRVQKELLKLAGKVYLKSSTQLMIPLAEQSWPRWYKNVNLKLAVKVGRKYVGKAIVDNQTTLLEVPGNYTSDVVYRILYQPSLIVDKCTVTWWRSLVKNVELELPVKPPPSKTELVVVTVMLLLVVALVGVLVILFHQHLRRSLQAASARPWLGLHRSGGNILLVHAHDSAEVVVASHALTHDITSQCSRKVLDMCCLNDPSFVEDPSTWLLKMLTQKEVTVLLVLTPALTKVANKLKQSQDPEDWDPAWLGPETDSRDPLIYDCLRSLQEKPTQYHCRLILVRLPKDSTDEESGLLHLTPRRPFLLSQPQDREHLMAALHPKPARPTMPTVTPPWARYSSRLSCIQ